MYQLDRSIESMCKQEVGKLNDKIEMMEYQPAVNLARLEEHAKLEEAQINKNKMQKEHKKKQKDIKSKEKDWIEKEE